MNAFYRLPAFLKWLLASLLLLIGMLIMVAFFDLTNQHSSWWALIFLLAPVFMFTTTPFMTLIGVYKYFSPMLLVFSPNQKVYDLHNGTSFDYLFLMRNVKAGSAARRLILFYYLEGLLQIIHNIKDGKLPETLIISGSSYFFSDRTAEKLGFSIQKGDLFVHFNTLFNIIDLTWMYSYAHGRIRFPNLSQIRKLSITGSDLLKQEARLIKLKDTLSPKEPSLQA